MPATSLSAVRSAAALAQYLAEGGQVKYLFFWGHAGRPGAPVGKECLSQWYPAPFDIEGRTYATAEHFMMAEKARLFGDEATRAAIIAAKHPDEAKRLGRTIVDFDNDTWDAERFGIVVRGNEAKFGQYPELRAFLQASGERVLVEASPVDAIWGIGLAQDDARAADPAAWLGLNLLGFALMEVRARLASA